MSTLFRAALVPVLLAGDAPLALPPRAVVLVVAGWCAPCRGELAHADEIAAAAAPRALRVAAIDDLPATRAMLETLSPSRVWALTPADRVRFAALVYARSAGLPYALATDGAGRRCADRPGVLEPAAARALVAACPP